MSITRDQLQARAEAIADQLPSTTTTFVTAAQAVDMVNDGIRALYDDVIDANPDFRVTEGTVYTITSTAANFIPLPADFRSVRAVLSDPGTLYQDVIRRGQMRTSFDGYRRQYRVQGQIIYIEPRIRALGNYQLLYNPTPPTLANGTDVLDYELEQFQDVIVLHAAVLMLTKNEWDISSVGAQLAVAKARAARWARNARTADPPMVEDVRSPPRWRPQLLGTSSTPATGDDVITVAANVVSLAAIDVSSFTGGAICLVLSTNRLYYLVQNTGNPDDSATTANFVNALNGGGKQWRGQ